MRRLADARALPARSSGMPCHHRGFAGRRHVPLAALGVTCLLAACEARTVSWAGACQIEMLDGENRIQTTLQVDTTDALHFTVTNGVGSEYPVDVPVVVDDAGNVTFDDACVPAITRDELLQSYAMQDNIQLTFLTIPDHPCTDLQKALIYFLVMEWFYFG